MNKYLNLNNNYELLRYKGGVNIYSYLNQCTHYNEIMCAKLFFDKYELKFKDLKFIKIQYIDGFIRYIHPNNNIYIFELDIYNWYTIDEYYNKFNKFIKINDDDDNSYSSTNKINYIDNKNLYNKILNMLIKKNNKKEKKRKKNTNNNNNNNIHKKIKI